MTSVRDARAAKRSRGVKREKKGSSLMPKPETIAKKMLLFDLEKGFYEVEVPKELENFPYLMNEAHVLGLSVLQDEGDNTYALGFDMMDGAVSPWFDDLERLEKYCLEPRSREEMRRRKSRFAS
jgi:hypothetical protein